VSIQFNFQRLQLCQQKVIINALCNIIITSDQ